MRPSDTTESRPRSWATLSVAGLIALLLQLPFFDRWFSHVDEGHLLLYADLLAKGGELYRDATLYPLPGAFHFLAAVFRVFGTSILVARWIVVVEFALFVVLVLALLLRAVRPGVAFLGFPLLLLYRIWAFPHWHMYSYSTMALCLLVGALLALVVALDGRRLGGLAAAGLLAGLGTACKQDYGGAAILAMSVLTWAAAPGREGRLARLAALIVPAAAVGGLLALYYASHGLLLEMLRQVVWGHLQGIASFSYPTLPPLLPLFEQAPSLRDPVAMFVYAPGLLNTVALDTFREHALYRDTLVWDLAIKTFYYGPYLLVALSGALLWTRRHCAAQERRAFGAQLALWSFGFACLVIITINRPQDYAHVAVLYWPFLALALVLLDAAMGRSRRRGWPLMLVALAGVGSAAVPSTRLFWELRTQHSERLALPRGGIFVRPHEARTLEQVVEYIHAKVPAEQAVAAMPYFPIALFLAERRGPHRSSYVVWPVADVPDRDRVIARAIDDQGVDTVLWNWTQVTNFPPVEEYAPELFGYLVDQFEIDRVFTQARWGYLLAGLRRSPTAPEGSLLLERPEDASALWIETREGKRWPAREDDWEKLVRIGVWPFRRTVSLRPSANGGRTVVAIPLDAPPPGARLETAIAVHPRFWFSHPPSAVTFEVRVVAGDERETVFSKTLDPNRELADRGWFDVRVPLERFAGQPLTLELTSACEDRSAEQLGWAGWEIPRLWVPAPLAPRGP